MKALKIIGIAIGILIVLFLLLGLMLPKTYHVERSLSINAPQDMVFTYVKYFKKTKKWSPWEEYDPDMITSIEGEDGTVGARYIWEGNDQVGTGEQEITAIVEGKRVDTKLKFVEPWESESMAYLELEPGEDAVTVTWGLEGKMPFPSNVMALFMPMDKMIGPDYEKGLNKLKSILEDKMAIKEKYGYLVYEKKDFEMTFLGTRKTIGFNAMQNFYSNIFGALMTYMERNELEMDGSPAGIYWEWDMENMKADLAAAVPVKDITEAPTDDFSLFELTSEKALVIKHWGSYDGIGKAHGAMDAYIKDHELTQKAPVVEMYVTDPQTEPDTSKWLTKIIYMVD